MQVRTRALGRFGEEVKACAQVGLPCVEKASYRGLSQVHTEPSVPASLSPQEESKGSPIYSLSS